MILEQQCTNFLQELYEPLWEEIHARSKQNGFRIRSIWMSDVAQEGQSSVINEHSLGNDRMWHESAAKGKELY